MLKENGYQKSMISKKEQRTIKELLQQSRLSQRTATSINPRIQDKEVRKRINLLYLNGTNEKGV